MFDIQSADLMALRLAIKEEHHRRILASLRTKPEVAYVTLHAGFTSAHGGRIVYCVGEDVYINFSDRPGGDSKWGLQPQEVGGRLRFATPEEVQKGSVHPDRVWEGLETV